MKKVFIITIILVIIDQLLKFYVKLNFELGEELYITNWFKIILVENPGIAYGLNYGGYIGKIFLTFFRLCIIILIYYYGYNNYKKSNYFIIPYSFIFAGSIGNLIDGLFYGLIFDKGLIWSEYFKQWIWYKGISSISFTNSYSGLFKGVVVDMLSFDIFTFNFPNSIPIIGGYTYHFFNPVFNIADSLIFIGGIFIILFRNKKSMD